MVPWRWSCGCNAGCWASGAVRNPASKGVVCLKALERETAGPDVARVLFFLVGDGGTLWGGMLPIVGVEHCRLPRLEFVKVRASLRVYCSGVLSHIISSVSSSEVKEGVVFEAHDSSLLVGCLLEEGSLSS